MKNALALRALPILSEAAAIAIEESKEEFGQIVMPLVVEDGAGKAILCTMTVDIKPHEKPIEVRPQ